MTHNPILQKSLAMSARSDLQVSIDTCRAMIESRIISLCESRKTKCSIMDAIDHLVGLNRVQVAEQMEPEHIKIAEECGIG